jgi:hypothetical protein
MAIDVFDISITRSGSGVLLCDRLFWFLAGDIGFVTNGMTHRAETQVCPFFYDKKAFHLWQSAGIGRLAAKK